MTWRRTVTLALAFSAVAATSHGQLVTKKALTLDAAKKGKVIGAIGVSGETPAEDEEIAIAGANAAKALEAR